MPSFLPDPSQLDRVSIVLFLVAVVCLVIGLIWLGTLALIALFRGWKRARWPVGLLLVGTLVGTLPYLWTTMGGRVVDLGPRERIVDGERHITLTGWDHPAADYERLMLPRDTVVLQVANPDVTDEEVERLEDLELLRELDLNNSQVTDACLPILAKLPALRRLKLRGTRITDEGFRVHLAGKESLEQLDVSGTAILPETVAKWRGAKEGRRALGP